MTVASTTIRTRPKKTEARPVDSPIESVRGEGLQPIKRVQREGDLVGLEPPPRKRGSAGARMTIRPRLSGVDPQCSARMGAVAELLDVELLDLDVDPSMGTALDERPERVGHLDWDPVPPEPPEHHWVPKEARVATSAARRGVASSQISLVSVVAGVGGLSV